LYNVKLIVACPKPRHMGIGCLCHPFGFLQSARGFANARHASNDEQSRLASAQVGLNTLPDFGPRLFQRDRGSSPLA
jgi:hypothetical protein